MRRPPSGLAGGSSYSGDAHRRPLRQERADLPRRARDAELGQIGTQFDGPGHIGVNTSKGRSCTTACTPGTPTSAATAAAWWAWARSGSSTSASRLRLPTRGARAVAYKKQGQDPGQRRDAADPQEAGRPRHPHRGRRAGHRETQGLGDIGAGDCVALHTGQGNSWSNDRYKTMNAEQRKAARDSSARASRASASAPASTWPRATSP